VHPLAECLLAHVRRHEFLKAGDRLGVAVSGGLDSVALLRLFLELRHELGIVLSVVHFNHKLRGADSEADRDFVAALAREHDLECHSDSADVREFATQEHLSLETAARELRYSYFRHLLGEDFSTDDPESKPVLDKIATAHTLDDQAETVLMRVVRGTGLRGLAAIHPRIAVEDENGELSGEIVRPLLSTRRRGLEQYLAGLQQSWREDATNAEHKFTRNRMRRELLPIIEQKFNPAIAENLSELAEIARAEEDYWENESAGWHGTTIQWFEPDWLREAQAQRGLVQIASTSDDAENCRSHQAELLARVQNAPWLGLNASLSRMWLLSEPLAVQRRVIKSIGNHARIALEFKHVEEILQFAAEENSSGKELSLPQGWMLRREPESLVFVTPGLRHAQPPPTDYDHELSVPGITSIPEAHLVLEIRRVSPGEEIPACDPDELLDPDLLTAPLRVRNWRPGDRFWPAHTKSPKKIKDLLQEHHVRQPERKQWPVVMSGYEIIWMRGFPVPAKFRAPADRPAILIVAIDQNEPSSNAR
jgi:tRNA(Ile)-lysidine synthase